MSNEKIDLGINNEPTPPRRPAQLKKRQPARPAVELLAEDDEIFQALTDELPETAITEQPVAEENAVVVSGNTAKLPNVRQFEFGGAELSLARQLGVDLSGSIERRINNAIDHTNQALRMVIEAGLALLSVHDECEHGQFMALLGERGMPHQRAYETMTYAKFAANLPDKEREQILSLPKTKVLALAKADPEVLQDLFDDEDGLADLTTLSVRDMRLKIRELEARKVDQGVELETAETQIEALQAEVEKLRSARVQSSGIVPIAVQDTRLEIAALHKKAELSIDDISRLTEELLAAPDVLGQYETPVARGLYRALCALSMSITGTIAQLHATYGDALGSQLAPADWLSDAEVAQVAAEYKALVREHDHEALDRQWEREMDRPAGRGRPKKRPTLG